MEIKPIYVTFEQSKLLKEKGFNEECRAFYLDGNLNTPKHSIGNYNNIKWVRTWRTSPDDDTISAPEQWQVVEWLRVNHGIWITPIIKYNNNWYYQIFNLKSMFMIHIEHKTFNTPQEAYSAAFDYVLDKLI
jgi:hypothetical protein